MPRYPTRSYVRAHPSFELNDGSETLSPAKRSPSKRSPAKQSTSRQSPYKPSPSKRSQRNGGPSNRPKVKVMTLPVLREGSVQPTPRTTDPTTPQGWNPPPSEELGRAPKKLRRASRAIGGDDGSFLATHRGVPEDISPLTSFAPGRLSMLPEAEVEDESTALQREYTKLMEDRDPVKRRWGQMEKENHIAAGQNTEAGVDVDQAASSVVGTDHRPDTRGLKRIDTEEQNHVRDLDQFELSCINRTFLLPISFSMQASPPKPWERGAPSTTTPLSTSTTTPIPASTSTAAAQPSTSTSTAVPSVPQRPTTLTTTPAANSYSSPYSTYNSPYSRFGNTYSPYGASMYGGLTGYGGYGGYGMNSMYGGMPGMGMGMYGPTPYDPGNQSLGQSLEGTTQHTFALLHSIVQTFTGVSQMLESTFMATHSSFFAMVGVVEQFGQLRNALGSVLGLFGLLRWMKELITGRPSNQLGGEFREFINGRPVQGPSPPPGPRPSRKPLIIFLLAIFGVPYAMHKLVKTLSERQRQEQQGQILPPLDPSMLTFARALYPFQPASPTELELKENEIVAIVGRLDPSTGAEVDPRMEVETDWWKGRTRDGREGWFPRKWVQIIEKKKPEGQPLPQPKVVT